MSGNYLNIKHKNENSYTIKIVKEINVKDQKAMAKIMMGIARKWAVLAHLMEKKVQKASK
jgi:hypothetical protein